MAQTSSIKDAALSAAVDQVLKHLEKDEEKSLISVYHDQQPFNENMLRPCPMPENPECLRAMVKETGAVSTYYESPEDVDTLCDRTTPHAQNWQPVAELLSHEEA